MRPSTARLVNTPVRLARLSFPRSRVHVHRTRLAFIHLNRLLDFAKIDRDGRVDGFVAAYLPDEVALLLLRKGEIATAIALTEYGRTVVPIATALKQIGQEVERGELAYCDAPLEQLAWMYSSCATPAAPRPVDPGEPDQLFPALRNELFTGVLELIVEGRVNYFHFDYGEILNGYFDGKDEEMTIPQYTEHLVAPSRAGAPPEISAAVFPTADALPEQASPALVQTYRELFWSIADAAEREVPVEAMKHAYRSRDSLAQTHPVLDAIGTPLDREAREIVVTPEQLPLALADWALQLLEQLEIIAPGVAPDIVRDATKEHRFVLQKAGFYDRLPWTPTW